MTTTDPAQKRRPGRPRKSDPQPLPQVQEKMEGQEESVLDGNYHDDVIDFPPIIEEEISLDSLEVSIAADGMKGAFMRLLVEGLKMMVRPWDEMTEAEQKRLLDHFGFNLSPVIHDAVKVMASKGRKIVFGRMAQVTTKADIKAVIECRKSPESCAAFGMSAGGGGVAMILMDTEGLLEEMNPIKPDPDQPALPLEEGTEEGVQEPDDHDDTPPFKTSEEIFGSNSTIVM